MIKYLSNELWNKIKLLSENTKNQMVVVSPYVGSNLERIINFKGGDVLITAVTKTNVEQGNLNPNSLEKLISQNVEIFSIENLHSKIYYFEESVIVCSSNLSENSKNNLYESGIWTDNEEVITNIRDEINSLQLEEINLDFIQSLKQHYAPSRRTRFKGTVQPRASDVWALSVMDTDYTEEEMKLLESKKEEYEHLIGNGYEISDIRFEIDNSFINEVKIGDRVIEIKEDDNTIYAPKKVLGIELGPKKDGKIKVKFLRLESPVKIKKYELEKLNSNLSLKRLTPLKFNNIEKKLNIVEKKHIIDFLK